MTNYLLFPEENNDAVKLITVLMLISFSALCLFGDKYLHLVNNL